MADAFKRAQMKANRPHCGPDCCGSEAKKHGQARAAAKRDWLKDAVPYTHAECVSILTGLTLDELEELGGFSASNA